MKVTVAAPAKINLWLRVGAREPSGFHAIDTLFCALQLADSVVVRPGDGPEPTLELAHARPLSALPDLGPAEQNLAIRAARAYLARVEGAAVPEIRLVKRIPPGGGLGGGSSDAAAVLRALARLNPGRVEPVDLAAIGAELGSDVAFFAQGAPLAHGAGRGDRLAALPPLPARNVVVVMPEFGVPTTTAFRWLDEDRETAPAVPAQPEHDASGLDWETVAERAVNDFEGPVFRRHPDLARIRDRLRDHGAQTALLAGSGSSVFGVFEDRAAARAVAAAVRSSHDARALITRTRTR